MKEINGYLLVPVPENAFDFKYHHWKDKNDGCISCCVSDNDDEDLFSVGIKGNYSIIGLAKDLTEEQWNNMVDNNQLGCFDNYRGKSDERYTCQTATESGHSLLKANNLNPNTTLILKKIL